MDAKHLVLLVSAALFLQNWFILFRDSFYMNSKAPALYVKLFYAGQPK